MSKEEQPFAPEGANGKEVKPRAGSIPFRRIGDDYEFLLVTTESGSGKWVFPKGKIDERNSIEQTLKEEGHEEAGITKGAVLPGWGANYHHSKRKADVVMRLMHVDAIDEEWAEQDDRERRWCSAEEVRQLVSKDALLEVFEDAYAYLMRERREEKNH